MLASSSDHEDRVDNRVPAQGTFTPSVHAHVRRTPVVSANAGITARFHADAIGPAWLHSAVRRRMLATGGLLLHFFPMSPGALSELMRLPARQRLAIAERLWISVADERKMPVPEGHKRIRASGSPITVRGGQAPTPRHDATSRCVVNSKPVLHSGRLSPTSELPSHTTRAGDRTGSPSAGALPRDDQLDRVES